MNTAQTQAQGPQSHPHTTVRVSGWSRSKESHQCAAEGTRAQARRPGRRDLACWRMRSRSDTWSDDPTIPGVSSLPGVVGACSTVYVCHHDYTRCHGLLDRELEMAKRSIRAEEAIGPRHRCHHQFIMRRLEFASICLFRLQAIHYSYNKKNTIFKT